MKLNDEMFIWPAGVRIAEFNLATPSGNTHLTCLSVAVDSIRIQFNVRIQFNKPHLKLFQEEFKFKKSSTPTGFVQNNFANMM